LLSTVRNLNNQKLATNRKSYRYRNERMVHNVELTLGFVTIDLMILSEILSIKNMRHIWTEMNLYYLLYCF